jgi:hypothetical protein
MARDIVSLNFWKLYIPYRIAPLRNVISYKLSDAAHAVNILCYYAIQIFCIQHNDI